MEPVVQISDGNIRGNVRNNSNGEPFYSFTCIPYGRPPIGDLRFKAPQPVLSWEGVKDATQEEKSCFQLNFFTNKYTGSEDCLSLHVFTKKLPNEETKLKPVMVYIHGGGFVMGNHDTTMLGPEYLMTEDIVLVSITYRIGFLGFLRFADLSLEVPGNAGLKDQVLALKWVQKNIEYFNGDPNNVTIFGESAGGASVEYLIVSPSAKNLFHKAIIQSGSVLNPWARGYFHSSDLAEYVGKPSFSEHQLLKYLIDLPVDQLYELQAKYIKSKRLLGNFGLLGPVIEKPNSTAFLTKEPMDIIQSGDYNTVPVIMGYANNEGAIVLLMEYLNQTKKADITCHLPVEKLLPYETDLTNTQQVGEMCKHLNDAYCTETNKDDKISLISDALFVVGIITSARNQAKFSNSPVYLYRFALQTNLNMIKRFGANISYRGASHGDDIGYFFKNSIPHEIGEPEKIAQRRLIKLWTNFATYGNPTSKGTDLDIEWKPVDSDNMYFLDISEEFKVDVNPEAEIMKVWHEVYKINPITAKYV